MAAAVGLSMIRRTLRPEMVPASLAAWPFNIENALSSMRSRLPYLRERMIRPHLVHNFKCEGMDMNTTLVLLSILRSRTECTWSKVRISSMESRLLRIVEVGGDSDDGVVDGATKVRFGGLLHFVQDHVGNLFRGLKRKL